MFRILHSAWGQLVRVVRVNKHIARGARISVILTFRKEKGRPSVLIYFLTLVALLPITL